MGHKTTTKRCPLFCVKTLSPISHTYTHKTHFSVFFSLSLFSLFYNSILYVYAIIKKRSTFVFTEIMESICARGIAVSNSIQRDRKTTEHENKKTTKNNHGDLQFKHTNKH